MVLFTMQHIGALYQIITFKCKYHPDEENAYLLVEEMYKNVKFLHDFEREGFFKKVIFYKKMWKKEHLEETDWETQICNYYQKLFEENSIEIEEFSDVYLTFDTYNDFLVYASIQKKSVMFIEMSRGEFSNKSLYSIETNFLGGDYLHEEVARKYDVLNGEDNVYVKRRYVFEAKASKDVAVDFIDEFFSLQIDAANNVKRILGIGNVKFPSNSTVYFLNSSGYTVPKSHENAYTVHGLICDFYLKNKENVWIKDHPANYFLESARNSTNIFDVNALEPEIPIEMFFLGAKNKIKEIVSCNSTSNEKIKRFVAKETSLGDDVIVNWRLLFKVDVAFEIYKFLGASFTIHYMGINRNILRRYIECNDISTSSDEPRGINPSILKGKIFTMIDVISAEQRQQIHFALREASNDAIVVFFNSNASFDFLESDFDKLHRFSIIKIVKENDGDSDYLKEEYIFIYSKDDNIHRELNKFSYEHYLPHMKLQFHIEHCNNMFLAERINRRLKDELNIIKNEMIGANNHTYKAVIWHSGRILDNNINQIKYAECRNMIRVLGIAHMHTAFAENYGYPSIRVEDIPRINPEVIIVMEDGKLFKIAVETINKLYPSNKYAILPYKAFSLYNINLRDYYKLFRNVPTIFANNCWGGITYNRLGIEFKSPLVNMFFLDDDYIKFLKNPRHYLGYALVFDRYEYNNDTHEKYPVIRCDDIYLYCNHYKSFDEANRCWCDRVKRVNWNNIFIMMHTKDKAIAKQFTELPYEKKICFVPFEMTGQGICYVKFAGRPQFKGKPFFWMVNEMAFGGFPYYDVVHLLLTGEISETNKII